METQHSRPADRGRYVADMDPTLKYLWSIHAGLESEASDWAIALLDAGNDSEAVRRLTYGQLSDTNRERLTRIVIAELNLTKLLDPNVLTTEYERASIDDYFQARIDGPTLIQRCCDIHWDHHDPPGLRFWTALADDACQHDSTGYCIDFDFINQDFDTALRSAILQSERPLPEKTT